MNSAETNYDPTEIAKFSELASRWWDPGGEFKTLHEINPLRLKFIDEHCGGLKGKKVLDIGCGGGILAEAMAHCGAEVTAIDLGEETLEVARLHLLESGEKVNYRLISAEQLAAEQPGQYQIVTCMEMLEHVPEPASVIDACSRLVEPNGSLFLSTLNRNPKSYLFAIVGAEYLMKMLPRGTHDYARFIRPSELESWCRSAGIELQQLTGLSYNPFSRRYHLGRDIDVNYLAWCTREGE